MKLAFDRDMIVSMDPDGNSRHQPTEAEYAAFKAWVLNTYGQGAWTRYITTQD